MGLLDTITQPKADKDHIPLYITIFFFIYWLILAIHPVNRWNWFVENILVVLLLFLLIFTYRRFRFSNLSYILITLLLAFHAIGAHYTYGGVPFSFNIPLIFNPARNNFDRFVHFAWGLFISYPIYELLLRIARISMKWICSITLSVVIAASSVFELIEMWGSKMMAKDNAAAYLGTQGDIWDAHEDIAMALYGSLITLGIILAVRYYQRKRKSRC